MADEKIVINVRFEISPSSFSFPHFFLVGQHGVVSLKHPDFLLAQGTALNVVRWILFTVVIVRMM